MKKVMLLILCLMTAAGMACTETTPGTNGQQTETPSDPAGIHAEQAPETPAEDSIQIVPSTPEAALPTPPTTPEPTEEPMPEPTPEPTPVSTPTPRPTPQQTYGAPQSFQPTETIKDDRLPVVYRMYEMNPKGKKEAQMFTYDLNGDGKAEKISFKLDYKKNQTTITAGKIKIILKDGSEMTSAMLIDLDPATPYTDLIVTIDMGSDDYITIPLHIENGKFVRGETLSSITIGIGGDGVLYRCEDTDLLGTRSGWRSCHGENFEPDDEWLDVSVPTEEELQRAEEELEDFSSVLRLKRELPCTIGGEPATLPVGTILYMTRFHESRRFAEIRTTDGVTAVVAFTMDEDSWPYRIDGVSQDDYFEYELLYAD